MPEKSHFIDVQSSERMKEAVSLEDARTGEGLLQSPEDVPGGSIVNDGPDPREQRRAALLRIAAARRSSHSPFEIAKIRRHFESESPRASDPQMLIGKLWGAATEHAVNWSRIRASVAALSIHASSEQRRNAVERLRNSVTIPQLRAAIASLEVAFRPIADQAIDAPELSE